MEPTDQRRATYTYLAPTFSVPLPQWSPPESGGTTVQVVPETFVTAMLQWSPPMSGE